MTRNKRTVTIIGSGWYGCHLALSLYQAGHNVTLLERNESIFSGASFFNQNRLHLGFHYPRSYITRVQSKRGYRLFTKKYSDFLKPIDMNIYAISSSESILDFKTYCDIMTSTGLEWEDVTECLPVSISNISGALACEELLIDTLKSKQYFEAQLKSITKLSQSIRYDDLLQLSKSNDLVLDCTWNQLIPSTEFIFEPCIMFTYKSNLPFQIALTFMDGPLFSLFPYRNDIYTLSHVRYTPLGVFSTPNEAYKRINSLTSSMIEGLRRNIVDHVMSYFPLFSSSFEYDSFYVSIKTKQISSSCADRNTFITPAFDNCYSIHSGKIDTVFDIEHQVATIISNL